MSDRALGAPGVFLFHFMPFIAKTIIDRFMAWTKVKIRIHLKDDHVLDDLYFREREIWWAHLGQNIGHEENGKNEQFERPVIILRKFGKFLLWVVPTSTKIKKENPYYHAYSLGNERYSALLSQMRPISSKRLIRRLGIVSDTIFAEIQEKIVHLIKNDLRVV